jgi:hypothetical protein
MGISKFERSAVNSKPWKQNDAVKEPAVNEKSEISTNLGMLFGGSNVDVDSSKPHVRKTARKSTITSSSSSLPVSTGVTAVPMGVVSKEKNQGNNNCVISSGPPLKKPRIETSGGQQQQGSSSGVMGN